MNGAFPVSPLLEGRRTSRQKVELRIGAVQTRCMNETKPEAFNFPRLMLITQRALMISFAQVLEAALEDGARLIQLREKDLDEPELRDLARSARVLCEGWDARLLLNGSREAALEAGAHGVQLPLHSLTSEQITRIKRSALWCGVSVHSLDEARQAQYFGADYLILGSIFPTQSHPGAAPLGLQVLAEVASAVRIPVYAIGGINSQNARSCLEAGAHGVAAIRAAWNPEERHELLRIVEEY